MPLEARVLVKTALLYLVAGLGLGVVRGGQAAGVLPGGPGMLWLPQLHVLTVGWITQLIFGVAYWLFPAPDRPAAATWSVWGAYGALNAGLLLRVAAEPGWGPPGLEAWGLCASAVLQWAAAMLLVAHFWPRVRSK